MNKRQTLYRVLFLSALLLASSWNLACTPKRSLLEPKSMPGELIGAALIKTPSPILRDGKDLIKITSIDGTPAKYLENKIFVSPGTHTIQVRVELRKDRPGSTDEVLVTRADTSLTFEAEANAEYLIDAKEDRNGVWIWAINVKNQYVVAGDPPRDHSAR